MLPCEPLKMTTINLRQIHYNLLNAGVKSRIVYDSGIVSYTESGWQSIAWSKDTKNIYRYLVVKGS